MFVIHTTVPLDSECCGEAMEIITDLVEHSQTEDGTVRYRAMQDVSDPNVVRFFEQFEDVAAAAEHTESEPYRRFVEALPDLVSGPLETIQFETDELEVHEFDAVDAIE